MRAILSKSLLPVMLVMIWSCGQKSNDDHHDHEGHDQWRKVETRHCTTR